MEIYIGPCAIANLTSPSSRSTRCPAAQTELPITRIINYHLQQYSASSCRVALEDALNAGLFRKKTYQQAPSIAPAHHVIIYASIPTIWLRYVIIYPAPLSQLPPTNGCSLVRTLLIAMEVFISRAFSRIIEPSFRRIRYNFKMTSTNDHISVPTSWPFRSIWTLSGG
jgi:hypothetical protein